MGFPKYATLIWNSIKDWEVKYTEDQILDDSCYINTIHLRKINKDLQIYGKIKHNYINIVSKKYTKKIYNLSLLKSNLQKCVRRGDIDRALITSLNLIRLDFWHFVRRLIIIAIEDVGLIENLDFIVWLMVAYPNFEITNEIIHYLLLTVLTICKYQIKYYPTSNIGTLNYENLDYSNKNIISLLIRGEYGGLKSDTLLINKFINSSDINIIKIKLGKLDIIRNITNNDILRESVDFHCYPDMLSDLSIKLDINPLCLKSLIWENNSKYNFRDIAPHTNNSCWKVENRSKKEDWDKIKEHLRLYQNEIIQRLIIK